MPELPEVAALAEHLSALTNGCTIAAAELAAISVLKTFDPPLADCVGREVLGIQRRGKFLCWQTAGGPWIILHLARAGWLKWSAQMPAKPAAPGRGPLMLRLVFVDQTGQVSGRCDLTEAGTRKSSALYVVADPSNVPGIARLGPDPMADAFTVDVLGDLLAAAKRAQLKGVLRDQSVIAGIGNAYSDEILHAAQMSPFRPSNSLSPEELATLYGQLRTILTQSVERARHTPIDGLKDAKRQHMRVHGRAGQPCGVCGDTVREVSYADSALQYCPNCQTGGKPLADRRLSRLLK